MTKSMRQRLSAPTIYDIARLAAVSPSTVSRALSKPGRLNAETERRVREAADELGYRLNPMARSLHTGLTGNIALLVSDMTNPVYFSFVRGAERLTAEAGSTLLFADAQENADVELETAERMVRVADGLILVGSRLKDSQIVSLAQVKPLITVNRVVEDLPAVSMDVHAGIGQAITHLGALGHRHLAYVSGPESSWMNSRRQQALTERASQDGLDVSIIATTGPTIAGGRAALDEVVASGATAAITYNDLLAFGLLQGARDHDIDVPGRLTVVGFDDIFGADLLTPALTTVRSPMGEVGERAVRAILREIRGEDPESLIDPTTELVVRDSSGPVPEGQP